MSHPQGYRIQCKRCGKWWTVQPSNPERVCDCHLYCSQGTKPTDCSVTVYNFTGEYAFPLGLEHGNASKREKRYNAYGYCSVHDEWTYKYPVIVEVPEDYFERRLPPSQSYTRKASNKSRYR